MDNPQFGAGGEPANRPLTVAELRKLRGLSADKISTLLGIGPAEAARLQQQAALVLPDPDSSPEGEPEPEGSIIAAEGTAPAAVATAGTPKLTGIRQVRDDAAILALNLKEAYRLLASFIDTAHHAAVAVDSYLDSGKISARTVKDIIISLNDISRHYFMAEGEISNPEWAAKTRRLFEIFGEVEKGGEYDHEFFHGRYEEIVRALSRSVDPAKRVPRA